MIKSKHNSFVVSQPDQTEYISVDEALNRLKQAAKPVTKTERIPSKESLHQILADDLDAQRDIPAFDNSAMDGYLFLTDDLKSGKRNFNITGEIRPEDDTAEGPDAGTCKHIMTGAPVPAGNFTVVPVEMTSKSDAGVKVLEIPDRNPIRKQGEGYKKGKRVLPQGTVIRPYEMGLMIESGNRECNVKPQIQIALQVTGSEIDEDMNTNGPVIEGLINSWPGTAIKQWPVLYDDPELVLNRMKELKESADVVLTTGGISMGKHDYILGAMEKLGAEVIVRKIKQKPGKPLTITRLGDTLFFHLPGNPVSAVFTAEYYVRYAVKEMLGLEHVEKQVVSAGNLENKRGEKTLFVPGKLKLDDQSRMVVSSEGVMKSHLLQLYRDSDVYIRLDPDSRYSPGDKVRVIPYSTMELP
ncbi:molybdopterin molybdotransferase MoeA [soil metagenome]